jgi:hypothetical protein
MGYCVIRYVAVVENGIIGALGPAQKVSHAHMIGAGAASKIADSLQNANTGAKGLAEAHAKKNDHDKAYVQEVAPENAGYYASKHWLVRIPKQDDAILAKYEAQLEF